METILGKIVCTVLQSINVNVTEKIKKTHFNRTTDVEFGDRCRCFYFYTQKSK